MYLSLIGLYKGLALTTRHCTVSSSSMLYNFNSVPTRVAQSETSIGGYSQLLISEDACRRDRSGNTLESSLSAVTVQ